MRLSVSNLAWDVVEDDSVARLLGAYGIEAIDIAPGKYFPDPLAATSRDVARVKVFWADRGIEIHALQGLLFGADRLNIFGSPDVVEALLARLEAVCVIAAGLGAGIVVFGSRANRNRVGLDDRTAFDRAVTFFRRAGSLVASYDLVMTLEAIPACYDANFLNRTSEAADVVTAVDMAALRLHLDTGAMFVNGENHYEAITRYASLFAHAHASDPWLATLGDAGCDHASVARVIERLCPDLTVTIEMLPSESMSQIENLRRALAFATERYGNPKTPVS
jgi:D-psicose/D-tagatose/L-ribulose 3-epimerase